MVSIRTFLIVRKYWLVPNKDCDLSADFSAEQSCSLTTWICTIVQDFENFAVLSCGNNGRKAEDFQIPVNIMQIQDVIILLPLAYIELYGPLKSAIFLSKMIFEQ